MYVSVEASKLTFPKGTVLFSLEGLTTQRKAKPSRGPASREGVSRLPERRSGYPVRPA